MEVVKVVALTGSELHTASDIASTVPADIAPKVEHYFDKAGFQTIRKFSSRLTYDKVVKALFSKVTRNEKDNICRIYTPSCNDGVSEISHGHFWASVAGLDSVPVINVTDGCSGSLTSLQLAFDSIHRIKDSELVAVFCCEPNRYKNGNHPVENTCRKVSKDTLWWSFSSLTVGSAASLVLIRKTSEPDFAKSWNWDTATDNSAAKLCYVTMAPFCHQWLPYMEKTLPMDESVFFCHHKKLLQTFLGLFEKLMRRTRGKIIQDAKVADYVLVHSNSVHLWDVLLQPFGIQVTDHVAKDIGNVQTATLWVSLARTLSNDVSPPGIKKVVYLGVASGASVTSMTFQVDTRMVKAHYLNENEI